MLAAYPQFVPANVLTSNGGTVVADGLLATVAVDPTGALGGSYTMVVRHAQRTERFPRHVRHVRRGAGDADDRRFIL